MIKASVLIAEFQQALEQEFGYIYGMTHEMWSEKKQKEYCLEWATDPNRENSCRYGGKWDGHWVTDCSGLFHYVFGQHGIKCPHGSNSMWASFCLKTGELKSGKRTDGQPLRPGTAVFTSSGAKRNHVGLYVGNGTVIEAKGAQFGVVKSKVSEKRFTHWGELKNLDLEETEKMADVICTARVVGGRLALRAKPHLDGKFIKWIPDGTEVQITGEDETGEWSAVTFGGSSGWCVSKWLERKAGEESNVEMVSSYDPETDLLTVPRKTLESIYDALGDVLGLRG